MERDAEDLETSRRAARARSRAACASVGASGSLNSTGTSVKDSARLASSETHTDSDSGENRYLAVPCSRNTGTNTMQMHSVERNVGIADFTGAVDDGLRPAASPEPHVTLDVLDHHRAVVDQDADRQREAAQASWC